MSCGGSQLGFPIHTKKGQLSKGPSNDYSCTVLIQSSFDILRKLCFHFPIAVIKEFFFNSDGQ